jgi:Protein of unknown function (DUF3606)
MPAFRGAGQGAGPAMTGSAAGLSVAFAARGGRRRRARHCACLGCGMEVQAIDPDAPGELERWAAQLAVPVERLAAAIRAVGTDVDKIKGYLVAHPSSADREG